MPISCGHYREILHRWYHSLDRSELEWERICNGMVTVPTNSVRNDGQPHFRTSHVDVIAIRAGGTVSVHLPGPRVLENPHLEV